MKTYWILGFIIGFVWLIGFGVGIMCGKHIAVEQALIISESADQIIKGYEEREKIYKRIIDCYKEIAKELDES